MLPEPLSLAPVPGRLKDPALPGEGKVIVLDQIQVRAGHVLPAPGAQVGLLTSSAGHQWCGHLCELTDIYIKKS